MNAYRIIISHARTEEGQSFLARVPELPGCEAEGATRAEVLSRIEEEIESQVANMRAQGIDPPPTVEAEVADGKIQLQISSSLHQDLLFLAKSENVTLEVLLQELLARSVSQRIGGRWRGGGGAPRPEAGRSARPREGQGQRYHEIMENRADFIEYVRSLETAGTGNRPPPRRGRR
jgi:predicted RNase H-like HicB family nuclease